MKISVISAIAGSVFLALFQPAIGYSQEQAELKVGVRSGPGQRIVEIASEVAAKSGVKITPVIMDGIVTPNVGLADGSLDANVFQHIAYLEGESKRKGYTLVPTEYKVYNSPLAVYSVKHKSVADIPTGGRIAIPQDTGNRSRALLALQHLGLIKLRPGVDEREAPITPLDIVENPRNLSFIELVVTVIPTTLPDVDAGAVSASHAFQAAKLPISSAIGVEGSTSDDYYAIRLVVRPDDKDKPWVATFGKALQSPEVKTFIEKEYSDALRPSF